MQIKGFRVYVVAVAMAVTLAVLLALQFIYQKFDVEQPLFKLYSRTKLVEKAPVIQQKGGTVLVTLDVKKTENLKKAYQDLVSYTEQVMGNTRFSIELRDNRTKELEDAYYQSQFIIYEAISKGDFSRMADVIRQNAGKAGAEAKVFIDNDNIYVEFLKGNNYLYEIVPRKPALQGGASDTMGSDMK